MLFFILSSDEHLCHNKCDYDYEHKPKKTLSSVHFRDLVVLRLKEMTGFSRTLLLTLVV